MIKNQKVHRSIYLPSIPTCHPEHEACTSEASFGQKQKLTLGEEATDGIQFVLELMKHNFYKIIEINSYRLLLN